MVRVLHAGDFHLDSAFGALTPDQARQRRAESRGSVQRLVDWANDHDIQLMLLAGDLFDGAAIGGDTARLLAEALGSFQGQVVIAPATTLPTPPAVPTPVRCGLTMCISLQRIGCRP